MTSAPFEHFGETATATNIGRRFRSLAIGLAISAGAMDAGAIVYTKGESGADLGESRYSIEVSIPPGTAKLQPALSFEYSSSAPNWALGVGWRLRGASAITRCPATTATDGTVGGVQLNGADRFCLDGRKLLVQGAGQYGADGTQYRTEVESFAKIVSYGTSGNGPGWFRVWTKAGQVNDYGATADSRILATGTSTAHTWAINRVSDRKSNYYLFTYTQNSQTGEFYPARIDYTGNSNAGTSPYNSVQFVYEARSDVEKGYIGTSPVSLGQRMAKVQAFAGATLVREYRLSYETAPASARSRLTSITECSADSTCLPATNFGWINAGGGIAASGSSPSFLGWYDTAIGSASEKLVVGDFNGDGISDVFVNSPAGPRFCYGPSFASSQCRAMGLTSGTPVDSGDFNGDGISDLALIAYDGSLRVCYGPNFGPNEDASNCWRSATNSFSFADHKIVAGDFNGDGRSDVYIWSERTNIYPFATVCDVVAMQIGGQCMGVQTAAGSKLVKGDFDGDGRTDLLFVRDTLFIYCTGAYLSNPTGQCIVSAAPGSWRLNAQIVPGDFNGDGKTDVMVETTTDIRFCPGPGVATGLGCSVVGGTAGGDWNAAHQMVAGDFNGDGRADVLLGGDYGLYFCKGPEITTVNNCLGVGTGSWRYAAMKAGDFDGNSTSDIFAINSQAAYLLPGGAGQPDLMQTVTNGIGAQVTYAYQPLTSASIYTKGTGAVYPNLDTQLPAFAVSQWCTSNAVGGMACVQFNYSGAVLNLQGRGFIGFSQIKATDVTRNRITTKVYRQDFPFYGLVSTENTTVNGVVVREVQSTYQSVTSFQGAPFVSPVERSEIVRGLDGNWRNERVTKGLDAHGNTTGSVTYFGDGPNATSGNGYEGQLQEFVNPTYSNDVTNWLLGRLDSRTLRRRIYPAVGESRTTTYSYEPGTLLLAQENVELGNPAYSKSTIISRDAFGNEISRTVNGHAITPRTSSRTYDAVGRFVLSETNALSQTTTHTYDPRFGTRTSSVDPNSLSTTWTYDSFGRKIAEIRPDGSRTDYAFSICGGCMLPYTSIPQAWWLGVTDSGYSPRYQYFDQRDRRIRITSANFDNTKWIDEELTEYDDKGRPSRKYVPHERNASIRPFTSFSYDSFGRLVSETAPNSSVTTYGYSTTNAYPVSVSKTDALGRVTTTSSNYRQEPIAIVDAIGSTLSFSYDAWGKQISVARSGSGTISEAYDLYGRKVSMSDPDLGNWTYTYNVLGELVSQTDAKAQTTTYTYDLLGRRTASAMPGFTAGWTFDSGFKAIGKLSGTSASSGVTQSLSYDAFGRLSSRSSVIDGTAFAYSVSYDAAGRTATVTYPGGFAIRNVFNSTGALAEVRNQATNALIWKAVAISPRGIVDEDFGNGTGTTRVFDEALGRVVQITTVRDSDGAILQNQTYGYNSVGELTSRADSTQSLSESFQYDALSRITSVSGPSPKAFSYDSSGNVLSKSDVGSYTYPVTGKLHAVASVPGMSFTYDANGNMSTAGTRSIGWTAFNMPSTIQDGGATFSWLYDAELARVKFTTPNASWYYLQQGNKPLTEIIVSGTQTTKRHYIYANNRRVAVFTERSPGLSDVRYVAGDRLGSTSLTTNEAGQIVERLSYDATGKRRFSTGADDLSSGLSGVVTRRGFTGHEHLDELTLIHMNGRVYDPRIGRFISPDPRISHPDNGQSLNRYTYVLNQFLRYVDPDGFEEEEPDLEAGDLGGGGGMGGTGGGGGTDGSGGSGVPRLGTVPVNAERIGPSAPPAQGVPQVTPGPGSIPCGIPSSQEWWRETQDAFEENQRKVDEFYQRYVGRMPWVDLPWPIVGSPTANSAAILGAAAAASYGGQTIGSAILEIARERYFPNPIMHPRLGPIFIPPSPVTMYTFGRVGLTTLATGGAAAGGWLVGSAIGAGVVPFASRALDPACY